MENNKFIISFGEKSNGIDSSIRTYFFYVAPTGVETGLQNCNQLFKVWSKKREQGSERLITFEYVFEKPIILKMVTMSSQFGKPKSNHQIYFTLNSNESLISFTGIDGFGGFEGRAKIKEEGNLSRDVLKQILNYQVLASPIETQNKVVRKLIW